MNQHTPGPWTVDEHKHDQTILGHWQPIDDDRDEDDGESSTIARTPWVTNSYAAQNLANARLIAAAPQMLEVLDYIANHAHMAATVANEAGRLQTLDNIESCARAMIALATGGK